MGKFLPVKWNLMFEKCRQTTCEFQVEREIYSWCITWITSLNYRDFNRIKKYNKKIIPEKVSTDPLKPTKNK